MATVIFKFNPKQIKTQSIRKIFQPLLGRLDGAKSLFKCEDSCKSG